MARVKRSVAARRCRKKVLKQARGYYGSRKLVRVAREAVERAWVYAYRDRKARKRVFRSLWIARINAGARQHDITYSRLMHGMRQAGIELDRKILAQLALDDPSAFGDVVAQAKAKAS